MPEEIRDDPLQAVLDRLLDTKQARAAFERFQNLIDRAGNAIDPQVVRSVRPPLPRPRSRPQPPPAPVPRIDPHVEARTLLHFGPTDKITKKLITERRRALASLCHPDRGGSTDAMQRINQAADLLLTKLK